MTRIHLELEPNRKRLYQDALDRLGGVALADTSAPDALITGDVIAARETKVPVLLDRPSRLSRQDLAPLLPSRLMPAHEWRFLPSLISVQQSKASGQLGEPGLLRIHHWRTSDIPVSRPTFDQIDLAHSLFGSLPETRHFLVGEHYLQAHLGYPHGGMALIDVATHRPASTDYYSMHLIGSDGAAYADDHHNTHLLLDAHSSQALVQGPNRLLGVRNMLEEFLAGLQEDRPWSVSLEDTLNALTTLEEIPDA